MAESNSLDTNNQTNQNKASPKRKPTVENERNRFIENKREEIAKFRNGVRKWKLSAEHTTESQIEERSQVQVEQHNVRCWLFRKWKCRSSHPVREVYESQSGLEKPDGTRKTSSLLALQDKQSSQNEIKRENKEVEAVEDLGEPHDVETELSELRKQKKREKPEKPKVGLQKIKIENKKQIKIEDEKQMKIENEKQMKIENEKQIRIENEKAMKVENQDEAAKIKQKEVHAQPVGSGTGECACAGKVSCAQKYVRTEETQTQEEEVEIPQNLKAKTADSIHLYREKAKVETQDADAQTPEGLDDVKQGAVVKIIEPDQTQSKPNGSCDSLKIIFKSPSATNAAEMEDASLMKSEVEEVPDLLTAMEHHRERKVKDFTYVPITGPETASEERLIAAGIVAGPTEAEIKPDPRMRLLDKELREKKGAKGYRAAREEAWHRLSKEEWHQDESSEPPPKPKPKPILEEHHDHRRGSRPRTEHAHGHVHFHADQEDANMTPAYPGRSNTNKTVMFLFRDAMSVWWTRAQNRHFPTDRTFKAIEEDDRDDDNNAIEKKKRM